MWLTHMFNGSRMFNHINLYNGQSKVKDGTNVQYSWCFEHTLQMPRSIPAIPQEKFCCLQ